jgi:hypothetical protein
LVLHSLFNDCILINFELIFRVILEFYNNHDFFNET